MRLKQFQCFISVLFHHVRRGLLWCGAAAGRDHSHYDCFVLAVLTHGDVGDVFYGVDGESFKLAELMEPVKRCSSLAGKPKICIIQVIYESASQLENLHLTNYENFLEFTIF